MMHLAEYARRPAVLSDWLPWAGLVAPGVVLNKDGSFQRTARFRGPDLDSATEGELVAAAARLNNALRRFESGWALFVEAERPRQRGQRLRADRFIAETSRMTKLSASTYVEYGVVHYVVPNMPALVARTATLAYTDATLPAIRARAGQGVERTLAADPLLAAGLMVRAGSVVHAGLARDVWVPG
jgi:hypothetical protein